MIPLTLGEVKRLSFRCRLENARPSFGPSPKKIGASPRGH